MPNVVRMALSQAVNAYPAMPTTLEELPRLAGHLDEVRQANLDHNAALIRRAADAGAKIAQLGELFAYPYFAVTEDPMWNEMAEDSRRGPSVTAMRRVAAETGVVIVAPIFEVDPVTGKKFNTAVVIDTDGEVLGSYRKTHIPHGDNEHGSYRERYYYGASDGKMHVEPRANLSPHAYFPVFETKVARLGVAVCYDRHFDGVMRTLAQAGAQIVACPAVTFGDKSQRMWRLESATDACRHRVFIACSNRLGTEPPWDIDYFGDSHVMGPDGPCEPVSAEDDLVVVDVDLDRCAGADPAGWNIPGDRRPDIYGH
ncbi:MAG: nitrilase-related carbon-nitrogen hydrolase [Polyangiaceae bacterium]